MFWWGGLAGVFLEGGWWVAGSLTGGALGGAKMVCVFCPCVAEEMCAFGQAGK